MLWINLLHLYQPANADGHTIKEATEKSYFRIIRALEEHPHIKFTLNINGCLWLRWEELGYFDLIRRLGRLIKKGQVELTGNAAYHPLLPLIKKEEIINQVKETEGILNKILGDILGNGYRPAGFFLSEMAYSSDAAKTIKDLGYEWIMLDEISLKVKISASEKTKVFLDGFSGLKVILRDRKTSDSYLPDTIYDLKKANLLPEILITATDGELYGLRHEDPTAEFEKILGEKEIETKLISAFIKGQEPVKAEFRPSSWESTEKELEADRPYRLWKDDRNTIQQELWKLANLAYETVTGYKDDPNFGWARWHLVRGLSSCTFWWASGRNFKVLSPISWSPDEIERGTNEFIRSIRALENDNTREIKMKAEKLYVKIKQMVWEQHWTYFWKRKN